MSFINYSAFFVPNQCLFGAYPTQEQITELEEWGVQIIVNLTNNEERNIQCYKTNVNVIHFPILDNKIPDNHKVFFNLVVFLAQKIKEKNKIYIHCKGGHGRSGILVSALLCQMYGLLPGDSFKKTSEYHSKRLVHARNSKMNEYWKNKGSPQTIEQKRFVSELFQP